MCGVVHQPGEEGLLLRLAGAAQKTLVQPRQQVLIHHTALRVDDALHEGVERVPTYTSDLFTLSQGGGQRVDLTPEEQHGLVVASIQ